MKTLYLTGFMGSGKSTVGKELSSYLNLPVNDTDDEIVKRTGTTIREIFEQHGESYFRELESSVLYSLPTTNTIVTTGGGVVTRKENKEWMKTNGVVVYLQCDFDTIWSRLEHDTTRPLVVNSQKEQIKKLYQDRYDLYQSFDIKVDTSSLQLDEIVKEIGKRVENNCN
jgi:shikimate kinase